MITNAGRLVCFDLYEVFEKNMDKNDPAINLRVFKVAGPMQVVRLSKEIS